MSDSSDNEKEVSDTFKRLSSELNMVKQNIQDIREMNDLVKKNDQLQKKEVDHQKKLERDRETQAVYLQLKQKFSESMEQLKTMEKFIEIDKNVTDTDHIDQKEYEILKLNIQGSSVNLKRELEESHKIYGQYRQNFKDVIVRQFMNIDGGATQKAEVERLVEEDPNVTKFLQLLLNFFYFCLIDLFYFGVKKELIIEIDTNG
jgi:hypothetical protein